MPASIKHLTDRRVIYSSLLAKWKDGLYYTAVLTKCDRANKKCRVCFEDGSEIWVSNRDLHIQLTLDQLNEDEDIVCCICDDGNSEPPDEIILCDVCQQGYHQNCHLPPVDASKLDDSEETKDHKDWFCATCSFILNQTNRVKLSATVAAAQQQQQQQHERPTRAHSSAASSSKQQQSRPEPRVSASTSTQPTRPEQQIPQHTVIATAGKEAVMAPQKPVESKPQQPQQASIVRQPPKVKQTPSTPQISPPKSTIGAVKSDIGQHQRSAPYYPLSSQARAMATSSTAALASMTASSALVVGSSAGRTKQDLVKQSNRSTQRQIGVEAGASELAVTIVPKHAVRKSSINFSASPVKQSALPTATRSAPTLGATVAKSSALPATVRTTPVTAKPVVTMSLTPPVTTTSASQAANSSYSIVALTNQAKTTVAREVDETSRARTGNNLHDHHTKEQKSVISILNSSQQVSGLPISMIETELNSDGSSSVSSAAARDKQGAPAGNISSGNSSGPNLEPPLQTTADSARSSVDSGTGTNTSTNNASNKPATVTVGANLD